MRGRGLQATSSCAAVGVLLALVPLGAPAAARPIEGGPRAALDVANQEVAPQVTLVQRIAKQVVLRPLDDDRVSAKGNDLVAISELDSYDVPAAAMRAYTRAAQQMEVLRPDCQIPWTLLAGIGRVESDHGRYGGSVLGADGLPRPAIRGIALDGVGPVAAIADSDDGRWDDDPVWDRAVGPMQFIPTTWDGAGRDGDGDGVADPNDIDDAALAAADYLCPSSGSILSDSALDAAILSYNYSDYYVTLVRAFMTGYETGVFTLPSPPAPPAEPEAKKDRKKDKGKKDEAKEEKPGGASSSGPKPAPTSKPSSKPKPKPSPTRPKPPATPKPTPKPTPTPTTTPTPTATPTETVTGQSTDQDVG